MLKRAPHKKNSIRTSSPSEKSSKEREKGSEYSSHFRFLKATFDRRMPEFGCLNVQCTLYTQVKTFAGTWPPLTEHTKSGDVWQTHAVERGTDAPFMA